MPPTTSSTSGQAAAGQQPSKPYESKPPEWLPNVSRDGDLGYPGFYPPRPGQDEQILSHTNIKYGYTEANLFGAEIWPGTDTFTSALKQDGKDGMKSLQDLMDRVIARRAELFAVVEENSFKLVPRVFLIADKKHQWHADLANPNIPLSRLGKISNTQKNTETLDTLYAYKTPVNRAVWFIRYLGNLEMQVKMKNASPAVAAQTGVDWTIVITSYLKKQIGDLAIPIPTRLGVNIKTTFKKSKLSEKETRDAWVDKFSYSLEILRRLSDCNLIDQPTFYSWLAVMATPEEGLGPHQFVFIVRLADEYFDVVSSNRSFATPIIEGCLARFAELDESPVKQYAACILDEICSLILRLFLANADLFANRSVIATHSHHLNSILLLALSRLDPELQPKIRETVTARYTDLDSRVNAILSVDLPPDDEAMEVKARLEDIALLNTIDITTDLHAFSSSFLLLPQPNGSRAQSDGGDSSRPFGIRLPLLLSWAVTPGQAGSPFVRPLIAASLIAIWRTHTARTLPNASQALQRHLLSWLEEKGYLRPLLPHAAQLQAPLHRLLWRTGERAKGEVESGIATLFGELAFRKLFGFSDYLSRMTSFGQGAVVPTTGIAGAGVPDSSGMNVDDGNGDSPQRDPTPSSPATTGHLALLRNMPLWDKVSEQMLNQRRIVLYGIRARKTAEDAAEKEIRAEIRRILPLFFNGPPLDIPFSRDLLSQTLKATSFVRSRVVHHWLFDLVKDYLARTSATSTLAQRPLLPVEVYRILVQVLSWAGCYQAMFELHILILYHVMDDDLLAETLYSIRRYLDIWEGKMQIDRVVEVLLETHARLKEQTRKAPRKLLSLLKEIEQACVISSNQKESIRHELDEARKILHSDVYSSSPAPPLLPAILAAIGENSLAQPDDLATTMWYKNRTNADWGTVSWQAVITAIGKRSWDTSVSDAEMADRFTSLVTSIDAHLPDGIQDIVRIWLESSGSERLIQIDDIEWAMIKEVLLSLSLQATVPPPLILNGLVLSPWRHIRQRGSADAVGALARTLDLARVMLLQHIPERKGSDDIGLSLQLATCRVRLTDASTRVGIMRWIYDISLLISVNELSEQTRELFVAMVDDILRDQFLQDNVLSRTAQLQITFNDMVSEQISLQRILAETLRKCLRCESTINLTLSAEIDQEGWRKVLLNVDLWSFAASKLDLQLLVAHSPNTNDDQQFEGTTPQPVALHSVPLASAAIEGDISSTTIALVTELLGGTMDASLSTKILFRALEELELSFAIPASSGLLDSLERSKALLRLIIKFKQLHAISLPLDIPQTLQERLLATWRERMSGLHSLVNAADRPFGNDLDAQDVADAACFMIRALHLLDELFGPITDDRSIPFILLVVQLAVTFGGKSTFDETTFSLLVDTACVMSDDCSKVVKPQLMKSLLQAAFPASLPAHMPDICRHRLESLLPFIPHDYMTANLARAQRNSSGELEPISSMRSRHWEWMDDMDGPENSGLVSDRVRNSNAVRLENFETASKGESIIPTRWSGKSDPWLLRDGFASEGILARAWRESRTGWTKWDGKSSAEGSTSDQFGSSSVGFSPAAASKSTVSQTGSPSVNIGARSLQQQPQPMSIPTVETVDAEPMIETKSSRGTLKRKVRGEDEDQDDDVMIIDDPGTVFKAAGGTPQSKKPKVKPKAKR